MPFSNNNSSSSGTSSKGRGFSQYGGTSSSSSKSTKKKEELPVDPFDTSKIQKSIDNASMRIEDAGGEVNPDKRNRFEKFTNLPQGQNGLFDAFEIIGRPGSALNAWFKGKLDNKPGAEIEQDTIDAFKGKTQRVTGSELAREYAGIDNKYGSAAAGFAFDVVSDPTNIVPVGPIAKVIGKGVGFGSKVLDKVTDVIPGINKLKNEAIKPAANVLKEGLGNIFKYQHGWDRTLSGGKDDTLKTLYNETENNIKYMSENSLRDVTGAAKASGGVKTGEDVGRIMEKDVPVYGPKISRQFATDPKITKAADDLIKSNDTLRQWALDNDIPVGEIDGYMRHILSAEEQALRKRTKSGSIDRPTSGMNNPNKKILEGRKLQGSAEDINQEIGRKFFEPNAYFASAVGQKKLIDYGNAVKFRQKVLSNADFATKFTKGMPVPTGAEVINTNNYKFLDNPNSTLPDEIGGEYVVTKGVKAALDRYQKLTTDEGINSFLKAYDTGMSWWKRGALFSAGYHLRNDIGAKFNNYLAGMDPVDITKYSTMAMNDVKNALTKNIETPLYDQFRKQGLSSTSQSAIEFAKHGSDPEKAITNAVKDSSRTVGQKVRGLANPLRAFDNSQKLGNYVDQSNRFALFRWAIEKKGMTPEEAAKVVRETQFDYSRITKTEKEVFTRLAPFYRWSRNNIPFQLRKFAEDPARYSRVDKLRTNLQDSMGLEEQDTPDYMKQNFFMPVTNEGDGTGHMLGANLPVGDLTKLSNPGKLGLDSLTTALKLPIELVSNRNLFFNNDLKRFEGQEKKYQVPDDVYGASIPGGGKELGGIPVKLAYALEQLGGQPARALSKTFGKPTQQDIENNSLRPSLGISSLLKKYDIKETNLRAKQKELRDLMGVIDYLEQEQGERARSVNDIKKGK